ncbi:bifunctional aspartate kinase/homoserine dehydrogenase II [Ferrimonas lipolytica]|uniref:Bifunctional aspartokinase/homoserine dehydrogenase n=1 Tax=Ferrimonas lipolytica TaxID=2724191 RepID=A0A6H1UFS3_9GAMM|nr:bifunctional aspartate kinase/homoserine dehydrogenase II [Ferrimonas lipolytica]QIZ77955.1 bifunctional aspartate kinase/homoserine dehydrogenase II [Ferrimonas lipolytica]
MSEQSRCVHKFGGSSLADADCYRRVAHILLTQGKSDDLVVVSAAGKTTNQLIELLSLAHNGRSYSAELARLQSLQLGLIERLLLGPEALQLADKLNKDIDKLPAWLADASHHRAQVQALGELWSSRLLAALLGQLGVNAHAIDARDFLVVNQQSQPNYRRSREALNALCVRYPSSRLVITGYVACNEQGQAQLLGRNGSDYSATAIGAIAQADCCTIWTDVEGVFNADPNLLVDARLQQQLSLAEANRLAQLGSPVLHRRTLEPLQQHAMALQVRSSFTPERPYTRILAGETTAEPVITSVDSVVVLHCPSDADATAQAAEALEEQGIAVLVSYLQERAIVVTEENASAAADALERQFMQPIRVERGLGLVGLISNHAQRLSGAFARLLSRRAWPLQADELALITLVPMEQVADLTARVHRRCAGPLKTFGLIVAGKGNIGGAWLQQFAEYQRQISDQLEAELTLVAILGQNRAWLEPQGIEVSQWQQGFAEHGCDYQLSEIITRAAALPYDELILLDITASGDLALGYPQLLEQGIHLISANKQAGSGPLGFYQHLKKSLAKRHLYWRYNATVGAGLPVFYAIDDLRRSGDTISQIDGVFSGTLSWLFHHFDGSKPFSQLVLEAKAKGFTEPDPRDDLSGVDMQRKLLIVARELGLELELVDVELESLVPEQLQNLTVEQFLARIDELDEPMAQALASAQQHNQALRYIAAFEQHGGEVKAKVSTAAVAQDHSLATLPPGDNQFLLRSEHYPNGLVIQGPGAGREVTAAAVQSDLVAICRRLLH